MGSLAHRWDGLLGLRGLKTLDEAVRDPLALARLGADLGRIRDLILAVPRRLLVVSEAAHQEGLLEALTRRWGNLLAGSAGALFAADQGYRVVREAWAVATQVSFCARAYPTVPVEHPDAAALVVLGQLLTNGFLHRRVREEGGAYGAGAGYDSDTGSFRFYSYRDPRLAETLADFDAAIDWLATHAHEPRTLEEAILGVVAAIDRPESPAGEAIKAFFGTLHGRTPEQRRRFRLRVLAVTLEDLLRVGKTWLGPDRASTAVLSDRRTLERVAEGLGLRIETL